MSRDAVLTWISRIMYGVAVVAVASLIIEYGFYLRPEEEQLLHLIDIAVVGIFGGEPDRMFPFPGISFHQLGLGYAVVTSDVVQAPPPDVFLDQINMVADRKAV